MHAQRAYAQHENQSSKCETSERRFERPNPFSVKDLPFRKHPICFEAVEHLRIKDLF
jgi:hypothetical protein